jgi:hypothetical protein
VGLGLFVNVIVYDADVVGFTAVGVTAAVKLPGTAAAAPDASSRQAAVATNGRWRRLKIDPSLAIGLTALAARTGPHRERAPAE